MKLWDGASFHCISAWRTCTFTSDLSASRILNLEAGTAAAGAVPVRLASEAIRARWYCTHYIASFGTSADTFRPRCTNTYCRNSVHDLYAPRIRVSANDVSSDASLVNSTTRYIRSGKHATTLVDSAVIRRMSRHWRAHVTGCRVTCLTAEYAQLYTCI